MRNVELTREEMELLGEVFQHAMNELDIEIHRSDTPDFKAKLKHRRALLEQILGKLSAAPAVA